ncbi:MAG: Ig-like domain-containing protein, partial [SAR324 cluster bacterium]|nr:Ig-like domain-containing protein [SAR324 cluster bacterium]
DLYLTFTATYAGGTADLTEDVLWETSASAAAQVSNGPNTSGHIRCQNTGTATITATWISSIDNSSNTDTATITHVTTISSLAHSSELTGVVLGVNDTELLDVYATTSTAVTYDATNNARWTSSNPEIASVSNNIGTKGLVVALSTGITTITAAYGDLTLYFSVSVQ